jgi:hypothetical protein
MKHIIIYFLIIYLFCYKINFYVFCAQTYSVLCVLTNGVSFGLSYLVNLLRSIYQVSFYLDVDLLRNIVLFQYHNAFPKCADIDLLEVDNAIHYNLQYRYMDNFHIFHQNYSYVIHCFVSNQLSNIYPFFYSNQHSRLIQLNHIPYHRLSIRCDTFLNQFVSSKRSIV